MPSEHGQLNGVADPVGQLDVDEAGKLWRTFVDVGEPEGVVIGMEDELIDAESEG